MLLTLNNFLVDNLQNILNKMWKNKFATKVIHIFYNLCG
jgi:hypothetical protein